MSMKEFKEIFITEAEHQISLAENGIEDLKAGNDDEETLSIIKRAFHTLKGNSATMGFDKMFKLSKALNDLSEKIIEKVIILDDNSINYLSRGPKILVNAISCIKEDKPEEFNDENLTQEINNIL